jgi:hypothetical protein
VLVRLRDHRRGEDAVLTDDPAAGGGRADIYDGQEWWSVSRRFLVPRALAWTATAELMRTGRRASDLTWSDGVDLVPAPPDLKGHGPQPTGGLPAQKK